MLTRTGVLALAALALGPAAARAAAPVSVPAPDPLFHPVAYAAGRVVWATATARGPIVVHQRLVSGGRATTLATIPRVHPSSRHVQVSLAANASGYVVAARDGRRIDTGECG